jgi:1-acyl-sn-glycerol-3-phosphate acyltransferase
MIYDVLRWITGIALHWFYRDIRVVGHDRIPLKAPLLVAVNHQNALVDSLIAGWVIPRRLAMTAKATLADNAFIAFIFRLLNVVPLRRVSDELQKSGSGVDRTRNAAAFSEILRRLEANGAVLIFPEGKSHNESGLEPLKSGLARVALQARDECGIKGVQVLPLGLVFEDKASPGSIVGVRVGRVIELDLWPGSEAGALTADLASRLREVSEAAGLPPTVQSSIQQRNFVGRIAVTVLAFWGRTTHRLPIRIARSLAIQRSTNADEPAMLTIVFGIGLVLLTYIIQLALVSIFGRSLLLTSLYLVSLVAGAYWAAFEEHPRRYY